MAILSKKNKLQKIHKTMKGGMKFKIPKKKITISKFVKNTHYKLHTRGFQKKNKTTRTKKGEQKALLRQKMLFFAKRLNINNKTKYTKAEILKKIGKIREDEINYGSQTKNPPTDGQGPIYSEIGRPIATEQTYSEVGPRQREQIYNTLEPSNSGYTVPKYTKNIYSEVGPRPREQIYNTVEPSPEKLAEIMSRYQQYTESNKTHGYTVPQYPKENIYNEVKSPYSRLKNMSMEAKPPPIYDILEGTEKTNNPHTKLLLNPNPIYGFGPKSGVYDSSRV